MLTLPESPLSGRCPPVEASSCHPGKTGGRAVRREEGEGPAFVHHDKGIMWGPTDLAANRLLHSCRREPIHVQEGLGAPASRQ